VNAVNPHRFFESLSIPSEPVFCPGCGKELGRRPKLFFEDIKRRLTGEGAPSAPVRVLDDSGHPLDLGHNRYVYLCAECAKRWREHDQTLDA
jgi:hypothetical protein